MTPNRQPSFPHQTGNRQKDDTVSMLKQGAKNRPLHENDQTL